MLNALTPRILTRDCRTHRNPALVNKLEEIG